MSFRTAIGAAALLASVVAAPSQAADKPDAPKPARQCFWTQQINGFAAADEKIVNVRVGVRDVYQFEMFGRCDDVDWANRIAVRSRGGSHICEGIDAEIISPTTLGPRRCPVKTVRKLTPAEVAALPKRSRP